MTEQRVAELTRRTGPTRAQLRTRGMKRLTGPGFSRTAIRESVRVLLAWRGVTTTPVPASDTTGSRAHSR